MAEALQSGQIDIQSGGTLSGAGGGAVNVAARREPLVRAAQVAREAEVRESSNGVRFATFGETGVEPPDLDRMLGTVPAAIVSALGANTYYFVPVALREPADTGEAPARKDQPEQAMVARAWSDDLGDSAICHRNVELGSGHRGVFISTRLMGDRFALSFEFFINVAHAFVDAAGVPERFAEMVWQQALDEVRGETSLDAWESRNLAFGRQPNAPAPEPAARRGSRRGGMAMVNASEAGKDRAVEINEKERGQFVEAAFSDAVAIYLLSLALDFDYSELREREYPLLAPGALAARLRMVAEMFPPNADYEFSVRYRRRA